MKAEWEDRAMLLSCEEIRNRNLIQNPINEGYRAASYDAHIGKIVTSSGEELLSFKLLPQGTVLVISSERLVLPKNVAGYAMVKTSLCQDGVLATNIGIIDPGYEGRVSSYLINFGKADFLLNVGDPFLRLALHDFRPASDAPPASCKSDSAYVSDRKREAVAYLSDTFLDLDNNIKKATDNLLGKTKKGLLFWVPAFALFLALYVFGVTLGVSYVGREVSRDLLQSELSSKVQAKDYRELEKRVETMEQQLRSVRLPPAKQDSR